MFIVTADDFGLSKSTNGAIKEGIDKGIVTSTNIMVNMPFCEEGISLLENGGISVGIHWNVTTGKPISSPDDVRTLINSEGFFYPIEELKKRVKHREVSKNELYTELKNQMVLYKKCFGKPCYWNTHNHVQMIPGLFNVFVACALDYGIHAMRNNYKVFAYRSGAIDFLKNLYIKRLYSGVQKSFMYPTGLVCFHSKEEKLNPYYYRRFAEQTGVYEIMIHIASEVDSEMFGNMRESRVDEYGFFIKSSFRKNLEDAGIKICSFTDLDLK